MSIVEDNTNPNVKAQVETARIIQCCEKHYEIFLSALLAIAFVSFMSIGKSSNMTLVSWVVAAVLVLSIRFYFVHWFARLQKNKIGKKHIGVFIVIMLVWGLVWAAGTILFFPLLTTMLQAGWFAMFMVMVAASATSHSVYLSAFFAFSVPYFMSIAWVVSINYPSPFHINAWILTLVMITQVGAARKGQKVILEALRLRFQNQDLIERLRIERDAANKANSAKSKFLAAASHDLRQPLHALTLFSGALEDSLNNKQKACLLIGQINESVQALQGLFNALLDISRLDAGTLKCKKIHFDSRELFEKLKKEFTPLAQEKNLELTWDMTSLPLYTDPTLLELIIRNLVSNALRYTSEGRIVIGMDSSHDLVVISVVDTGIGIPISEQQHIFEEFFQLHNPERDRNKGLGLGLSIVKRVANLIDSDLKLLSAPDMGSQFSISVAKGDGQRVMSSHNSIPQEQMSGAPVVVVIDDELMILSAMQSLLEGWGYKVVSATECEQALQALVESDLTPDCIVADYRLRQEQTGVEAIKRIRAYYNNQIPGLIVTGDIAKERLQFVQHEGLQMLHKPVPPAKLRSYLYNQIR